jgi:hypothetical protein
MSAIQAVSQHTLPIVQPQAHEMRPWTDVKIQQVWLNAAAALSLIGSVVIVGLAAKTSVNFLPATPFLLLASVFFGSYSYSLIDYDDPHILAGLRSEALQLPLTQVVTKHGWEKLYRYGILSAADFDTSYRTHADSLSFKQLLSFYHQTKKSVDGIARQNPLTDQKPFIVPSPLHWKGKFHLETAGMRCEQIPKQYALDDLREFGILSKTQEKAIHDAVLLRKESVEREAKLDQQFLDRTSRERAGFQHDRDMIELDFNANPIHALLKQCNTDEEHRLSMLHNVVASQIRHEKRAFDQFKDNLLHSRGGFLTVADLETIARCERQRNDVISRLKSHERKDAAQISFEETMRRVPLQHSLNCARELRDRSIAAAKEHFTIATLPVRLEINAQIAKTHAEYESKIAALDKIYHK